MATFKRPSRPAGPTAHRPVPYQLHISGLSDIGQVRARNEDSLSLGEAQGIAVVADGMGGHPGGDVASRTAADESLAYMVAHLSVPEDAAADDVATYAGQRVQAAVLHAHHAVRERGRDDPDLLTMGTTLTLFAAHRASGGFAIGHVGDSRAYRLRNGALLQLTRDDTWVQERLDAEELTPEQAKRHPFGHILTQCVGLEEEPEPQVITGALAEGDLYLLCSDGLMGMVEPEELPGLLETDGDDSLESVAQRLVDLANERGGFDNITVVLVAVEAGEA